MVLAPAMAKATSPELSPAPSYTLVRLTNSAVYSRCTRYFIAIEGKLGSGFYTHVQFTDTSFSSQHSGEGGRSLADRCPCICPPASKMQERHSVPETPPTCLDPHPGIPSSHHSPKNIPGAALWLLWGHLQDLCPLNPLFLSACPHPLSIPQDPRTLLLIVTIRVCLPSLCPRFPPLRQAALARARAVSPGTRITGDITALTPIDISLTAPFGLSFLSSTRRLHRRLLGSQRQRGMALAGCPCLEETWRAGSSLGRGERINGRAGGCGCGEQRGPGACSPAPPGDSLGGGRFPGRTAPTAGKGDAGEAFRRWQ